jgi:hypothetical protein
MDDKEERIQGPAKYQCDACAEPDDSDGPCECVIPGEHIAPTGCLYQRNEPDHILIPCWQRVNLPLAPKPQQHTDEEHMANLNAMNDIVCDQDKFIKKLEARIKELEAVVKGMEDDPK